MTGEKVLDLLMKRLGNRTDSDLREACLLEMQMIQETKLEQGPVKPWFIISEETETETTPDERRVEVPDDFIQELEEEGEVIIVDSTGVDHELEKKTWKENANWHGLQSSSELPENYSLVGNYFMLFPIPTLQLKIKFRYYAKQTPVSDTNTETPWTKFAADLLIAETGLMVAGRHVEVTPERVAGFEKDIMTAWDRINRENTARAEANMNRRMG